MSWRPTTISFSSGGTKSFGHTGVMVRLKEAGFVDKVTSWYGCSAGSIGAYLCALGVSTAWMKDFSIHVDSRYFLRIDEDVVTNFTTTWGLSEGDALKEYVGGIADTWEPGSSKWTFADLRRERPEVFLGISATNLSKRRLEVFSHETTPNLLIVDAIRASSAIPFMFTPWTSPWGDIYCDGGITEECPWIHVKDKAHTLVIACDDCQIAGRKEAIESILDYFMIFLGMSRTCPVKVPRYCITVNNKAVSEFDFSSSPEDRRALFDEGCAAADAWLKLHSGETPGSLPASEDHRVSVENHQPSGESASGSHQSRNPLPSPAPSQGSRIHSVRSSRRWSL